MILHKLKKSAHPYCDKLTTRHLRPEGFRISLPFIHFANDNTEVLALHSGKGAVKRPGHRAFGSSTVPSCLPGFLEVAEEEARRSGPTLTVVMARSC